jgi:hypothetical protein
MKRVFPSPEQRARLGRMEDLGEALQVCLEEGGRPLPDSWDKVVALHGLTDDTDTQRGLAARCLEGRLCGPDEATLDATLRKCCGEVYPGRGPGWCPR